MFFNNNFARAAFGYATGLEENNNSSNGNHFEVTNDGPSTRAGLDPTPNGLSTAEFEDWWLAPSSEGGVSQYTGSTLLAQPKPTPGPSNRVDTGESYRSKWPS
jgi:hypothetical protein